MRKVLSFVLVLSLVLSSFSMAFAADTTATGLTDINGIANEDAIQVNYDLGIVTGNPDGTFTPDKAVNRAEFAAMLTRALSIPDSALAGYTTTSFKDTAGYTWAVPYLAFCQSKGILLGDGAGNVMPGKTITVNEAMTMALRAVGYTANSSLLVGAWPANYVSIAQNNDLYDDVATTTTVNKASAAQIIYNLLTVQKVAVNTDGTTDYLWDGKASLGIEANLLNTNLGCDSKEDAILGATGGTKYDDAIINITDDLGAFGTAYINSDDELVAFTKDSTALTGKFNDDGDFEVGDVEYDFADADMTTTNTAFFVNGNASTQAIAITKAQIKNFAINNSDDGETVTLNVDLSGKTINDTYSVVGWIATYSEKASGDVQEDISDKELLNVDFAQTDDKVIDMNSFELVGIASLDKIAKDDVVYVYAENKDAAKDIRKVAVGTETVEGTVDEVDDGGTITIADKEYDLAPATHGGLRIADVDVDDNGTFFLDANGEVFDFDGTSGSADTYGIVKATSGATSFDNLKIKLYKSDDSTKTLYLSESNPSKIDWVTDNAYVHQGGTGVEDLTTGAMIGYSLDNNGDIDTIDVTSFVTTATFQSVKVLKTATSSFSIDSDAVVFTYDTSMTSGDDYGVSALADVDTGALTGSVGIILNDDGDVAALLVNELDTTGDNYVYGVFNSRTTAKNDSGDPVYKYTGFIDGTAFSYKADDNTGDVKVPATLDDTTQFGVYKIKLDSSNVITEILAVTAAPVVDSASGIIQQNVKITDLSSDKTVVTTANGKYTVADDAVVYKWSATDDEFTISKIGSLRDNDKMYVSLYDTKGKDADGIASVVIWYEL